MTNITINIVNDINRHHELFRLRANEAIKHAVEAGKLLLQAKEAIPHGQWLPWLEKHIAVTPRQAQRYMQVAQGRPLPIRAIPPKATPVTYLEVDAPRNVPGDPESVDFMPETTRAYASVQDDGTYDCTRRPVRADWVEQNLMYYGLQDPASAPWKVTESAGVLEPLGTFEEVAA
jgi:hypothetical protein